MEFSAAPARPLTFSSDNFYNILLFSGLKLDDLTFLWTTCREVSHDFKSAVEHVFLTKHLKKTWIRLSPGFNYEFSHLDAEDSSRAIFRPDEIRDETKGQLRAMLKRLQENGVKIYRPRIVVQLRRYPDDTHIPGLEFNPETLEISLEWKGMYSEYFREEKERSRRLEESVTNMKNELLKKRRLVDIGELDEMEVFRWGLEQFGNSYKGGHMEVRAERIAKNMRRFKGVEDWSDQDEAGYRRLNDISVVTSLEGPYSDEEEEDEEEDEDAEVGDEYDDDEDDDDFDDGDGDDHDGSESEHDSEER